MPTNRHNVKAGVEVYASTLLEGVMASGTVDDVVRVRNAMREIIAYNRSHVELMGALEDAAYSQEQRVGLVRTVFAETNPALLDVLVVMAERGEMGLLPRVLDSYTQELQEKKKIVIVDVTTRVALDDHLRDLVKKKASADFGCDVMLNETVDPAMLGGIVMQASGKRIDASVDTLLENARSVLKKNR